MKPEWLTAIAAGVGAIGAVLNLIVTLRVRTAVTDMRQEVLDRVAEDYKRQDVCHAEMTALRESCSR